MTKFEHQEISSEISKISAFLRTTTKQTKRLATSGLRAWVSPMALAGQSPSQPTSLVPIAGLAPAGA